MENILEMPIKATFHHGHIDDMGEAFGSVIYLIPNPPWVSPVIDIPWTLDRIDKEYLTLKAIVEEVQNGSNFGGL